MIWWCRDKGITCSYANSNGYCTVTGCKKLGFSSILPNEEGVGFNSSPEKLHLGEMIVMTNDYTFIKPLGLVVMTEGKFKELAENETN